MWQTKTTHTRNDTFQSQQYGLFVHYLPERRNHFFGRLQLPATLMHVHIFLLAILFLCSLLNRFNAILSITLEWRILYEGTLQIIAFIHAVKQPYIFVLIAVHTLQFIGTNVAECIVNVPIQTGLDEYTTCTLSLYHLFYFSNSHITPQK